MIVGTNRGAYLDCWKGHLDCNCLHRWHRHRFKSTAKGVKEWGKRVHDDGPDEFCPTGACYPIPKGKSA